MDEEERGICQRVRQFREQIRWPQPAFAYELGVSKDQLASIEYCRTPLRFETGYRLCFMFDVSQEWLATGRGSVTPFSALGTLPTPQQLPAKMLFSEALESGFSKLSKLASDVEMQTRSGVTRERSRNKGEPLGDFDPTAFLIKNIVEIFDREKFASTEERKRFAIEASSFLNHYVLKFRRTSIARRVRGKPKLNLTNPHHKNLSKHTVDKAKKILRLQEKIKELETEVLMLESEDW
jgi:transcriptional regulator with XRE-family HTH domain